MNRVPIFAVENSFDRPVTNGSEKTGILSSRKYAVLFLPIDSQKSVQIIFCISIADCQSITTRIRGAIPQIGSWIDKNGTCVSHAVGKVVQFGNRMAPFFQLIQNTLGNAAFHLQIVGSCAPCPAVQPPGAATASWGNIPKSTIRVAIAAWVCGCPSPPIVP